MLSVSEETDSAGLINLKRLAYVLKSLTPAEIETLEILLDEEAYNTVIRSVKEMNAGERIVIDEW